MYQICLLKCTYAIFYISQNKYFQEYYSMMRWWIVCANHTIINVVPHHPRRPAVSDLGRRGTWCKDWVNKVSMRAGKNGIYFFLNENFNYIFRTFASLCVHAIMVSYGEFLEISINFKVLMHISIMIPQTINLHSIKIRCNNQIIHQQYQIIFHQCETSPL